jgi:hypothetical protein
MAYRSRSQWCRCALAGLLLGLIPLPATSQTAGANQANDVTQTSPQGSGDLAAAAKLAREQQAREKARRTDRSEAVNQMAEDLAHADEEPIAGAPTGYRYYYFKPGDYALLVPADAKPEARDSFGLRLFSSEALTSRIEVVLGDPIQAQGNNPEEILHNANAEYFGGCALNISGVGAEIDGHPSHGMGFRNCGLDHEMLGQGEFVIAEGYVVPVFCGYPMTAEDWDPRPNQSIKKIVNKYDRERNGYQVCNGLILPSVKFHPYGNRWTPKSAPLPHQKAVVTKTSADQGAGETSLGAFARAHKKPPQKAVMTELKGSAPGFTPLSFRYFCTKDNSACYSATLQLPVAAKQNPNFLQPYTGLFQYEVPLGSEIAIIQANTGAPSDAKIISREELINTKIDWWMTYSPAEHYSGVKQAEILSEELTELSGIPARLAVFRNVTGSQPVITYMAAYLVPGKFLHIRCTVPEKISGDAQSLCEHVVQSLEIPQQSGGTAEDDP